MFTHESPSNKAGDSLTDSPPAGQESKSHLFVDGRYSKNTVVSKTRFPPEPKAERAPIIVHAV